MVKHIIIWKLRDCLSDGEKTAVKQNAKVALESLKGKIDGLIDIKINTELLSSSNGDMMLDSTFEDERSLKAYQTHPEHVAAADAYVRPFSEMRLCCDFEV